MLVLLVGCGTPEPAAPRGFGVDCSSSADCGCHDASGNDPLCERAGSRKLSCLGVPDFQTCTVACGADGDCAEFGAGAVCDTFDRICVGG